jgi:hypothetical protein
VRVAVRITRRRLLVGSVLLVAVLAILSFALPYVGGDCSGLTKLFP